MAWLPKQRVVVPVDFSEASASALAAALELALKPEGVHLVHVLLPLDVLSPGVVFDAINDTSRRNAAQEALTKFVAQQPATGVQTAVLLGDPGTQITEYAAKIGAELIVIPSHGYHGVKRLLLGSVAERVIRHASCPVLVLRRPDAQ